MSEFKKAVKVLEAAEALGSKRKVKLELLEKNKENQALQQMFKLAYDWEQTFGLRVKFHVAGETAGVRTKPLFGEASRDTSDPWDAFTALLGKLRTRKLTGHAAKEAWDLLVLRLSEQEHQWFSRVLNRDLKIGVDRPTVEAIWPSLIRPFGVQLAKSMKDVEAFEPTEKAPWLCWPVIVEPKLDGIRLTIEYKHKTQTCTAFTREGHMKVNIQPIVDPLAAHLAANHGADCWVDSEVLADVTKTGGFNVTTSILGKDNPTADELSILQFHCFDLVHNVAKDMRPLSERRELLVKLFGKESNKPAHFILLKRKKAKNMEELMAYYNEMLDAGHEGVMVKFASSPYLPKRNTAWLKLKPTETIEAEITGFENGKAASKHEHHLGAFVVKRGDTGKTIRVGGGLTDVQRAQFWKDREKLMGKILEFKEEKRKGATTLANFPRFVRLRPDRTSL